MNRLFPLITIFCLSLVWTVPASAQETSPAPSTLGQAPKDKDFDPMEIFFQLTPEEQEEILAESELATAECQNMDVYAMFHDCECIGRQIIIERILQGPEPHRFNILNDVAKTCVNTPGVAGYSYESCVKMVLFQKGDIEQICECYTEGMVKAYSKNPKPDFRHIRKLGSPILAHCMIEEGSILPNNQIIQ